MHPTSDENASELFLISFSSCTSWFSDNFFFDWILCKISDNLDLEISRSSFGISLLSSSLLLSSTLKNIDIFYISIIGVQHIYAVYLDFICFQIMYNIMVSESYFTTFFGPIKLTDSLLDLAGDTIKRKSPS